MEGTQRFIDVEKNGVQNTRDIVELQGRAKSNTHRINKVEVQMEDLKKETSVLKEVSAVLKMQTELSKQQTTQIEKVNETMQMQAQSLTELQLITKQLKETQDSLIQESNEGKISSNKIVMIIVAGLIAGVPSLIVSWFAYKSGLK